MPRTWKPQVGASVIMSTLHLSGPDGQAATATSERAARKLAREWLGASRVTETQTPRGWQLWAPGGDEDSSEVVTVEVRR